MTEEMKHWIENASYEELLRKWRFATMGDPFFQGEIGLYYQDVMIRRRHEVGPAERIRASKVVGWPNR